MRRIIGGVLMAGLWATGAFAQEGGTEAEYLFVKEASVRTLARAQLGFGLLNSPGLTGGRGTPILGDFGIDFAATKGLQLSVSLPVAGTLSTGDDDFGVGNIVVGGKYVVPLDRLRLGLGLEADLPTARNGAAIGAATRPYLWFVRNQAAVSPYAVLSYVGERLTVNLDVSNDLQIFTKDAVGRDRLEDSLGYDIGFAHNFFSNIWVSLEFGGYSSLTYASNVTNLFGGAGIRFEDNEVSAGFHVYAPFRSPAKDLVNFFGVFDVRVAF